MNARRRSLAAVLGAAVLVLIPVAVSAQSNPDFLFHRPAVTLSLYGGWAMPGESSDVFDDVRDIFTVGRGAFDSATFGGELAWRATERLDVAAGVEYAKGSENSEYQHFVDNNELPIEQTTSLRRIPATVSVRGYLFDRGRTISRYAWVPGSWSPFLGAGAGLTWYEFKQEGDFIDFQTDPPEIYGDELHSKGRAMTFHVLAGLEASLSEHFLVRGEYRYSWASADLDPRYYSGYEPIDLGGGRATIGLAVRL